MGAARTREVAVGGLLTALTLVSLFLATIMPTSRLSFYALSSFSIAVIVIEYGIKKGWVFYVASSLLGIVIIPNKLAVIPFIAFFGIYGTIKYHVEKIRNIYIEYSLKLVYFNLWLFIAILTVREFFLSGNSQLDKFPLGILIIGFQIVFILYDYVYTLFIQYYNTKLRKILKI